MFRKPTITDILDVMKSKDYAIFVKNNHDLNLGAIRTNIGGPTGQSLQDDEFDDWVFCIYKGGAGKLKIEWFQATTDPGLHWLKNPLNPNGTAIMVPDQYRHLWTKGRHRRILNAFRQNGRVCVYRDRDRDSYLDMGPNVKIECGTHQFINLHPATYRAGGKAWRVHKWSAGCIVTKTWNSFDRLRQLREMQWRSIGTYKTSFTLLTAKDF